MESSPGDESKKGCWQAGGLGLKEPREGKDPGDDNHEMLLADEGGGEAELLDDGMSKAAAWSLPVLGMRLGFSVSGCDVRAGLKGRLREWIVRETRLD
jgi:hypothetical protein